MTQNKHASDLTTQNGTTNTQAFSLVELSIVLVILGLLTGGILGGQELIKAAELRSITTEHQKWQTAVNAFKGKYFAIPGDMNNAISFWGDDTTSCSDGNASNNGVTCNGNGDGLMNGASAAGQPQEKFMFWQHLQLAGLIEGQYTGRAGASNANQHLLGENAPKAKFGQAGWGVHTANYSGGSGNGADYAINYGNHYRFGTAPGPSNLPGYQTLTPAEAWNIDTKIDDGKPARGKVIGRFWNNACAAADDGSHAENDLEASYKLAETSAQCPLFFLQAY